MCHWRLWHKKGVGRRKLDQLMCASNCCILMCQQGRKEREREKEEVMVGGRKKRGQITQKCLPTGTLTG